MQRNIIDLILSQRNLNTPLHESFIEFRKKIWYLDIARNEVYSCNGER